MISPFDIDQEDYGLIDRSDQENAEEWAVSLMPGWLSRIRLDLPRSRRALGVLLISFAAIFALFAIQLFRVQIVDGAHYQSLAAGNRIRETTLYAERGKILDRNGKVLAENTASYQLVAHPYLLSKEFEIRNNNYQIISEVLGEPVEEIKQTIKDHGTDSVSPIVIKEKVSHQDALRLETMLSGVPAFSLELVPIRLYKTDLALGPLLGYVNRVGENDLKNRDDVNLTDFVGREGVEKSFDKQLRGHNGKRRVEVDANGHPTRTLAKEQSTSGKDLQLTIDIDIQKALTDTLQQQIQAAGVSKGSSVAVNPKTGEVLAMVSLPSYDNNQFSGGIDLEDYSRLLNNPDKPLLNRAISGGYPVGSVIKPLLASAALQENVVNKNTIINDTGSITLVNPRNSADSIKFDGYKGIALGPVNVVSAIAKSSNIYFYTVGGGFGNIKGLGGNRMGDYYQQFGLGSKTGIDLPSEISGVVADPDWKKQVLDKGWYTGDSYNISIGQGDMQVTPLQMAMAQSAIINDGKVLKPQLELGSKPQTSSQVKVDNSNFLIVQEGMRQAVLGGTVGNVAFGGLPPVAGKTGTAETVTRANGGSPHIWEGVYAPMDNPKILIASMIENGGKSSFYLSPVAASGFRAYFKQ